jgi:hypothetical protein
MIVKLKERFDIFKRDLFQCQYCGRTPPNVTLELDHIKSRAHGGKDSIDNYITSCFDCNRGKGKNDLDTAPPTLENKVALIKERKAQLNAYNQLVELQEQIYTDNIDKLCAIFTNYFPNYSPNDNFRQSTIKRFLKNLNYQKCADAMHMACSTRIDNSEQALRYFCGICWNWIKNPETRDW